MLCKDFISNSLEDATFSASLRWVMSKTPYSSSVYEEIVAHANLNLMTKLTDGMAVGDNTWATSKEQREAFRRAWIANTEVKLLERKNKLMSPEYLT